ncbi:MAG: hypothetical protein OXC37_00150 [Bdellovibrionaceae bacterium]|nr:hypothetical protein [Pseudobdellovibrionaceae bacterium]
MFLAQFYASLTDTLSIFFKSVYFFNSLDFSGYAWFVRFLFLLLFLAIVFGFLYILIKTIFMKRDITMMATVIGQEGEVTELIDDFGKMGWVLIYGENWKFKSEKPVKVGDTVKVIKDKKMQLYVQKVEESQSFLE